LVTVISGEEEHFEDFGESNTSELLLENSVESSVGEADSPLAQPSEQLNGSSALSPRYEAVFSTQLWPICHNVGVKFEQSMEI